MKIEPFDFPDDLYYDEKHNWARVEGQVATLGLSDLGQALAGEILYVEVPRQGRAVEKGQAYTSIESGKWVGRVNAVVSGTVVETNTALERDSMLVSRSPYDEGWFVKVEMRDPAELAGLMRTSDPAFAEFIAAERQKHGK